jgi:hypothetical protein
MKTIRIDFNSIGRDGRILGHQSRASEPLEVGDQVLAYEDDGYGESLTVAAVEGEVVRMIR